MNGGLESIGPQNAESEFVRLHAIAGTIKRFHEGNDGEGDLGSREFLMLPEGYQDVIRDADKYLGEELDLRARLIARRIASGSASDEDLRELIRIKKQFEEAVASRQQMH